MTLRLALVTLALLAATTAGAWSSAPKFGVSPMRKPAMAPFGSGKLAKHGVAKHKHAGSSRWATGLTYLGVGGITAGLGAALTAAAGPTAGVALAASVAMPLVVSIVEMIVFGGPRVARIMGGKPADARLQALVAEVANKASLPPPAHVFSIDTDEMNSFAAGLFHRDRTVAVTRGLRDALTENELKAVVAHEMGHLQYADVSRNMHLAAAAAGLGGIYHAGRALLRTSSSSSSSKKKKNKEDSGGSLATLGLGMMAAGVVTNCGAHLLKLGLGRDAEFRADAVAAELYGPETIASALRKIHRPGAKRDKLGARGNAFAHLYIAPEPLAAAAAAARAAPPQKRSWWRSWSRVLSTHPSMEERLDALQHFRAP